MFAEWQFLNSWLPFQIFHTMEATLWTSKLCIQMVINGFMEAQILLCYKKYWEKEKKKVIESRLHKLTMNITLMNATLGDEWTKFAWHGRSISIKKKLKRPYLNAKFVIYWKWLLLLFNHIFLNPMANIAPLKVDLGRSARWKQVELSCKWFRSFKGDLTCTNNLTLARLTLSTRIISCNS